MEISEVWKLADQLNVYEISLLLAGFDPTPFANYSLSNWPDETTSLTYPFMTIIQNAVSAGKIDAQVKMKDYDSGAEIDWNWTNISIESLSIWLKSKGATGLFFTEEQSDVPGYADNQSPFYAPKLAAAVLNDCPLPNENSDFERV